MKGPVVIGGDNLPSPVRIGLTDLQNMGGASGPPGPPGSGTTDFVSTTTTTRTAALVAMAINGTYYLTSQNLSVKGGQVNLNT